MYYKGDESKDDIGGAFSTHGWDEKCIYNFAREIWREGNIWDILA